ncbi:MAG TPA: HAD family hydrolase [Planctomycetaceae bacterium]|nr:HAD family hydrolase [Planctomycetaceae bacterium]
MNYAQTYLALIFDCDGTLTDSMPLHYVAWRRTLDRYGIVFPEDRFYAMGGVPTDKIIEILSHEQGIVADVVAVAAEKEREFLTTIGDVQPNPPVCEIARLHHGRLPMAVASGGIRSVVIDQLVKIQMHGHFDVIVAAEDTQRHKPEPDVFLEAAKRMSVPADRCLVFEDTDIGVTAARRAGMDFVDVRTLRAQSKP